MTTTRTPGIVDRLRAELDQAGIAWQPVRDYPEATFLPDSMHTIWWGGPARPVFRWGHQFEHEDRSPRDVIARLEGQPDAP